MCLDFNPGHIIKPHIVFHLVLEQNSGPRGEKEISLFPLEKNYFFVHLIICIYWCNKIKINKI